MAALMLVVGVVSIKPRHLRLNCGKPRLYVSIAKNHDFSGNYSNVHRFGIDPELIGKLTGGTHLSVLMW
jgi:hypothetical protein